MPSRHTNGGGAEDGADFPDLPVARPIYVGGATALEETVIRRIGWQSRCE